MITGTAAKAAADDHGMIIFWFWSDRMGQMPPKIVKQKLKSVYRRRRRPLKWISIEVISNTYHIQPLGFQLLPCSYTYL